MATAAGCQLVATCDLAIASDRATFATPGVRIGLFCSTPMVAVSRALGRKRALEMLLTGDAIDACTAAEWGLVNRVVPETELRAATLALAERIGHASAFTIKIGKQAFYRQADLPQAEAYAFTQQIMTENALAADAQEGICAFLEKRPPRWQGRQNVIPRATAAMRSFKPFSSGQSLRGRAPGPQSHACETFESFRSAWSGTNRQIGSTPES